MRERRGHATRDIGSTLPARPARSASASKPDEQIDFQRFASTKREASFGLTW